MAFSFPSRRSFGSSRNRSPLVGKNECVTSKKSVCEGGCLAFESNKACGLGLTGTSYNDVTTVYGSFECDRVFLCCYCQFLLLRLRG